MEKLAAEKTLEFFSFSTSVSELMDNHSQEFLLNSSDWSHFSFVVIFCGFLISVDHFQLWLCFCTQQKRKIIQTANCCLWPEIRRANTKDGKSSYIFAEINNLEEMSCHHRLVPGCWLHGTRDVSEMSGSECYQMRVVPPSPPPSHQ